MGSTKLWSLLQSQITKAFHNLIPRWEGVEELIVQDRLVQPEVMTSSANTSQLKQKLSYDKFCLQFLFASSERIPTFFYFILEEFW